MVIMNIFIFYGGKIMTIYQLREYFTNIKDAPAPLTEYLVSSGYQQKRGGYISFAKEKGIEVNYKKNLPTQRWHLIESYCN